MTRLVICSKPDEQHNVQDSNFVVFLLETAKLARVTKVDFQVVDFDLIVFPATLQFLYRAMHKECHWEELTLFNCSGSAGVSTFLQVAASMKVFKAIIIHGPVTVSVQAFRAISGAMRADDHGLEKLELADMKLSLEQTAALADGLRYPGCDEEDDDDSYDFPSSCFDDLSFTEVDFENDAAISVLASGLECNCSLLIFKAYECNLSDAQIAELVHSLVCHPLLRILALSRNHGGSKAVAALACLLEEGGLEILHFAYQSRCLSPTPIQVLTEALEGNERLELLPLSGNNVDDDGVVHFAYQNTRCLSPSHIRVLAEALEGNQYLELLNLSGNNVDDDGVGHLARILSTCPQLRTLLLTDNNISVRGLETLAAQNHPSSLWKLDLCGNMFTVEDGACHHLLNLLGGNPQLGRVSTKIGWKASESELRSQIQHLLDFNKSGRVLVAGEGTLPIHPSFDLAACFGTS